MKINLIIVLTLVIIFGCSKFKKTEDEHRVEIIQGYFVTWSNNDLWVKNDSDLKKLKLDFNKIEYKLIETLKDSTPLFKTCFKKAFFKKGDLSLICLIEVGSTHQLYQPGMAEIRVDLSKPCGFVFIKNINHLEKNRLEYYKYIKTHKINN